MRKYIPNFITLINLFCGCCAIVCVLNGYFMYAFYFFLAGVAADYADGLVARQLKVNSTLGKELDSLADMVTFGVLPGTIIYILLGIGLVGEEKAFSDLVLFALPGFVISMFSGLRLAIFNLDDSQSEEFIGLPTPSCSIFIVGLMLIYHFNSFELGTLVTNQWFLYPVIILFSYLLNANMQMFSLKFKGSGWKGNERRYIFLVLGIVLIIMLREVSFSLIILLYVLFSFINYLISPSRT